MFTYTMLARSELHDLKASDSNRKYNYLNFPRHGHYTSTLLIPAAETGLRFYRLLLFQPGRPQAGY